MRTGTVQTALTRLGESRLLWGLVVVSLFSHAFNLFGYPLYLGDEGIYMEQAWAVLRLGKLAPYTYFYDHAPAGWLLLAAWTLLLPKGFLTLGMVVNSGRLFMLLIQLASTVLLFKVSRSFTGSLLAAASATLMFSLSPLAVYYQRMVLLDNIMVFWVLLALYLVLNHRHRLLTVLASGACLGIAILTKENAIFFLPVMSYLLFTTVRDGHLKRFAGAGWVFAVVMLVSVYPLYALLKNELLPSDVGFLVNSAPAQHVSLIGTIGWQMQRSGGGILDPYSQFWVYFWGKWWAKDAVIIVAGMAATMINLAAGYLLRNRSYVVAALLCLSFALYLARGSVMLEFYVVPILPFLAINFGLATGLLLDRVPAAAGLPVAVVGMAILTAIFVYTARDFYVIDQTQLQSDQLAWVREHIPPSAILVTDDDVWVDLHEPGGGGPIYPRAHSHWKVAQDPAVQVQALHNDWRSVDYLIMSNKLLTTFHLGNETLPLQIYANSQMVAAFADGDVQLQVRKVVK